MLGRMGLLVAFVLSGCAATGGGGGNRPDATPDVGPPGLDGGFPDVVIGADGNMPMNDTGTGNDSTTGFDGCFGAGCGDGSTTPDGAGADGGRTPEELGNLMMDPPPRECRMDGTMGTPSSPPGCSDMGLYRDPNPGECDCPIDKAREGCPCVDPTTGMLHSVGDRVPCWTGTRAQRGQGVCADGMTTCEAFDEFSGRWGDCVGETLPTVGATAGAQACGCFSAGRWRLENTSPCFYGYGPNCMLADSCITGAVSTTFSGGVGSCPNISSCDQSLAPAGPFSRNWLTVDCVGRFNLTFTIKANAAPGAALPMGPEPSADCVVGTATTTGWYAMEGVEQQFPDLPGWLGTDWPCAQRMQANGGYFEMTVTGTSVLCEEIGRTGGAPRVFNRGRYCSCECNANPSRADCVGCRTGGSGSF